MLRFFIVLTITLIGVVVQSDPNVTQEQILAGPVAEKLPPLEVRRPVPRSQWNDEAKLWLARSCAGEAGFTNYDECLGIAWVYATRAKELRYPFVALIRRYSAAVKSKENKRREWILGLNLNGTKPKGWPTNLSWKKHKVFWFRMLDMLDDWAKGYYKNPVEGANHYGGPMDTPGKKWTKIHPEPAWLFRNSFYRDI
jgi:hypothetical protein